MKPSIVILLVSSLTGLSFARPPKDAYENYMRQVYRGYDKDDDQCVTKAEFVAQWRNIGLIPTNQANVDEGFALGDRDGNDCLDLREMIGMIKMMTCQRQRAQMVFNALDTDDDNHLTCDEMNAFQTHMVPDFATDQSPSLCSMIPTYASDPETGKVTFDEFWELGKNFHGGDEMCSYDQNMRDAYSIYDKNGDECITRDEMALTLETLGFSLSDDQLTTTFNNADTTGNDGCVGYKEFVVFAQTMANNDGTMRQLFDSIDANGDGFVTVEGVLTYYREVNPALSEEDAQRTRAMVAEYARSTLTYDEYVKMARDFHNQ